MNDIFYDVFWFPINYNHNYFWRASSAGTWCFFATCDHNGHKLNSNEIIFLTIMVTNYKTGRSQKNQVPNSDKIQIKSR